MFTVFQSYLIVILNKTNLTFSYGITMNCVNTNNWFYIHHIITDKTGFQRFVDKSVLMAKWFYWNSMKPLSSDDIRKRQIYIKNWQRLKNFNYGTLTEWLNNIRPTVRIEVIEFCPPCDLGYLPFIESYKIEETIILVLPIL